MSARTLGARLLREWRGEMPQSRAAPLLELDIVRLSKYENGRGKPGRSRANRIAALTEGAVPVSAWDEPDRAEAEAETEAGTERAAS